MRAFLTKQWESMVMVIGQVLTKGKFDEEDEAMEE